MVLITYKFKLEIVDMQGVDYLKTIKNRLTNNFYKTNIHFRKITS